MNIYSLLARGAAALTLITLLSSCGGSRSVSSRTPAVPVIADGDLSDWIDIPRAVNREQYSVAVLNDTLSLYVMMTFQSGGVINQIMMGGLTVWFDPTGEEQRNFGIRYPIGWAESGEVPPMEDFEPGSASRQKRFDEAFSELEIMTEADKGTRMDPGSVPNASIHLSLESETLVYELAIPLNADDRLGYAVGAKPGDVVQIGIETGEFDRDLIRAAMRDSLSGKGVERRRGDVRPGRRGGMGPPEGRRGGPGGRRGFQRPQPLKTWLNVSLSAPVDAGSAPTDENN